MEAIGPSKSVKYPPDLQQLTFHCFGRSFKLTTYHNKAPVLRHYLFQFSYVMYYCVYTRELKRIVEILDGHPVLYRKATVTGKVNECLREEVSACSKPTLCES